ncbi:MAG: polyprenyl synthetase family protein [Pseudomonadota bacterium]
MSQKANPVQARMPLTEEDIARLRAAIDDRLEHTFAHHEPDSRLVCAIRHGLLSPGKRLRPLITLLACHQCGGTIDDAMDAACAVEMVHAASLIMDDLPCMDNARLRRGAVTTHVVFGEGAAMLAAISLLNEAFRIISRCEATPIHARLNAIARLSDAVGVDGLAGGQDQDLTCAGSAGHKVKPATGPNGSSCTQTSTGTTSTVSLSDMEKRHMEKTGALFRAAAAIGGEFANANDAVIEHLVDYGASLGLAYQAFDDVIDVACTSDATGKDAAQDAEKSTVVSLLGTDGARILAERHLRNAIAHADGASVISPAPLADLARLIGKTFGSMTK